MQKLALITGPVILSLAGPAEAQEVTTYTYDELGRLVSSSTAGGPNDGVHTVTTFDAAGNRSSYVISGVSASFLSAANTTAVEGSNLVFAVTRGGSTSGSVSVNYTTSNGTAISGSDYTPASGTLTFAPGETSKTVSVATIADNVAEGSETVLLTLTSPTGGATITTSQATGTIQASSAPGPSVAIAAAGPVTEGQPLNFVVTRTGATSTPISVNYATSNGTALSGSDYVATSGTLTFAAGETSKTVSVVTIADGIAESSETLLLTLSSPTGGATISIGQATGTIAASAAGNVTLAIAGATATEGQPLVYVVTKTGSTSSNVSVNYASTAFGTATPGSDFIAVSGTLTFAPSETQKTISVTTIDDAIVESTETVRVILSNPVGATLTNSAAVGSINDNDTAGGGNSNPIAVNDSVTGAGLLVWTINVLANDSDPDGDTLSITSVSGDRFTIAAIPGRVKFNTSGVIVGNTYLGSYTISDGNGGTATATISVTITTINPST